MFCWCSTFTIRILSDNWLHGDETCSVTIISVTLFGWPLLSLVHLILGSPLLSLVHLFSSHEPLKLHCHWANIINDSSLMPRRPPWSLMGASIHMHHITATFHELHDVSNHLQLVWVFFNSLLQLAARETSKHCITGSLWGNSLVTNGFSSQRVSNVKSVSIIMNWCHCPRITIMAAVIKPLQAAFRDPY